uniref:Lipoprotein n=1 Tax=Ignavibacterium album TaxID=591197 RepID=A0A832DEX1_9BACT
MKKFNTTVIISLVLLAFACQSNKEEKSAPLIDGKKIYSLVLEVLDSTNVSANPLYSLIDKAKDKSFTYNKIEIDSVSSGDRKLYSLLLEHPIPAYNLFAVIDDSLNLLLKDVSLNGYISAKWKKLKDKIAIEVSDEFKSYEIFNLQRYSLYYPLDKKYQLVFRTFTFFSSPKDSIFQNIVELNDSLIKTKIPKPKFLSVKDSTDEFKFNYNELKYVSSKNVFDSVILKEINNTQTELSPNHILNKKSINDILEYSTSDNQYIADEKDFKFQIPKDWTKIYNVALSKDLNRNIKGIYYINQKLGVSIGILKIPLTDSAEIYVNEKFSVSKEIGNYKVRQSEVKQDLKRFYQTIEHNCGNKKYLIIIEGSKNIYKNNEQLFKDILSSFIINC